MSNFQNIDFEEQEQDELKEKLDLITITSAKNLDTLTGITTLQADAIVANTLKTGITTDQANAIVANTAKTGITTDQANAIVANNTFRTNALDLYTTHNILKHNTIMGRVSDDIYSAGIGSYVNIDYNDDLNFTKAESIIYQKPLGDTHINAFTSKKINFDVNAVTQFDSTQVKNLVDNITLDASTFKHNKLLVGEQSPSQLIIQHSDINSGNLSTTDYSIRVTNNGELRLNVPTGQDYEFRINNVLQYNNTQIKNLVDSITFTDTPTLTNNLKLGNTTLEHTNLLVGESSPNQLVIQHANLNSGNLSTTDYSIRVTENGELRMNVPTGQDYEFRINNVFQYNNTQIKNLIDNVTVTGATNLDSIRNEINNINIQSNFLLYGNLRIGDIDTTSICFQHKDLNSGNLANTHGSIKIDDEGNLKLNVPTSKTFEFQINNVKQYDNTEIKNLVDNISVTGAVNLDTINSNVSTNNAKVSSQWTNNGSEIHFNNNVGIRNSNPNSDLEIGDGTSNIRVRLNGQNGQSIASEIIFSDGFTTTNPEYFNGASIRFNSSMNRLEFLTDQNDDGTAEPAIYIVRATTPYVTMTDLFASNISVNDCNLRPNSVYCYGRRVRTATDTDQNVELSTSDTAIIYNNILSNGITYNTSTGFFSVSVTGLYHVVATLQIDCGTGAESELQLTLKNGTTNVLKARTHVSRAESNNDTAMQFNMNAPVRLATGINYNFNIKSNNTGSGIIQNDLVTNNSLMIKGLVLENTTTIPSDWGEANT